MNKFILSISIRNQDLLLWKSGAVMAAQYRIQPGTALMTHPNSAAFAVSLSDV